MNAQKKPTSVTASPPPPPVRTATTSLTAPPPQFRPTNDQVKSVNSVQFNLPRPISEDRPTGGVIGIANCKVPKCSPILKPDQQQQHIMHCPYPPTLQPMSPISENSSVSISESNSGAPGFNASCQQCLAERAAMEKASIASAEVDNKLQSRHPNLDGVDFPTLPSEETVQAFQAIEETRGRRQSDNESSTSAANAAGRTYECEVLCRKTLRKVAGSVGICFLVLGYMAIGGFVFMALESRKSANVKEDGRGRQGGSLLQGESKLFEKLMF